MEMDKGQAKLVHFDGQVSPAPFPSLFQPNSLMHLWRERRLTRAEWQSSDL